MILNFTLIDFILFAATTNSQYASNLHVDRFPNSYLEMLVYCMSFAIIYFFILVCHIVLSKTQTNTRQFYGTLVFLC